MKLGHFFLPHQETHQKSKLLHWHSLIIYLLLFILLQVTFSLVNVYRPGILGVNSSITTADVIRLTNIQREQNHLPPLTENSQLDAAAQAKAQNMFSENYWAHYSPSGKDPWSFINQTGYRFTYAGENLAKNFSDSPGVVTAWMNSPSHRENLLSSNYQDIGIAVVEGVLNGQKTTLVVQMFGTSMSHLASKPAEQPAAVPTASPQITSQPVSSKIVYNTQRVAGSTIESLNPVSKSLVDPYAVSRMLGIFIITLITVLLVLDYLVLRKRGVYRLSSHHFAHLTFLAVAGSAVYLTQAGSIL